MRHSNSNKRSAVMRLLPLIAVATAWLLAPAAQAAAPGLQGTTFNLTAQASYISQPDGQNVYSWGYGCVNGDTTGLTLDRKSVV